MPTREYIHKHMPAREHARVYACQRTCASSEVHIYICICLPENMREHMPAREDAREHARASLTHQGINIYAYTQVLTERVRRLSQWYRQVLTLLALLVLNLLALLGQKHKY